MVLLGTVLLSLSEITVCTGARCWRNGASALVHAVEARACTPVRAVGCSGVCPRGGVSVCEGPSCPGPPLILSAKDADAARASAVLACAAVEALDATDGCAGGSVQPIPSQASSSAAAGRHTDCPYCGESFSSRNQYYKHLRAHGPCGKSAVEEAGLDLDAGRPQRLRKIVLSVGYGSGGGEQAEAAIRAYLEEMEGAQVVLTRASGWRFRRSKLFQHQVAALEDTFVFGSRLDLCASSGVAEEPDEKAWLDRANLAIGRRCGGLRLHACEQL